MSSVKISEIYVTEEARKYPLTEHILKEYPGAKIYDAVARELRFDPRKDPGEVTESKKRLLLSVNRGRFIEKCPGTQKHICCNYFVTKNILGCPADCSYCYLQAYLNTKAITLFVNTEDLFDEFRKKTESAPFRIGTGEFSDSLFLDELANVNKRLVEICSNTNSLLELKTKSSDVSALLGLNHRGRTVMAWSAAPEEIINSEEKNTSSLEERITAASRCVEAGYVVAFHFDPIIRFPGWEKAYSVTVEKIFSSVPAKNIAWVSLGAFRFYPQLKPVVFERFPDSKILFGEFIKGNDGKFRYLKYQRAEMFEKITAMLRKFDREMKIYLCMESSEIWKASLDGTPGSIDRLKNIFSILPQIRINTK